MTAPSGAGAPDPGSPKALLDFLLLVGRLKTLPRQGWVDRGVPNPESVAEHTYRAAMMGWVLAERAGLDSARLIKLILVHDLPEVLAGDATPYAGLLAAGMGVEEALARWRELVGPEQLAEARLDKLSREAEAMQVALRGLEPALASELRQLWAEYAERRTPEARFAAQLDKLEALLQAMEYEAAGQAADVASFLLTARDEVTQPVLRELLQEAERRLGS